MPTSRLDLGFLSAVLKYRLRLVAAVILIFLVASPTTGFAGRAIVL
ncbi:MAG: hypothetical protein HQK59_13875 [Deltaproteobacteria bacterium]|nr:hypothetical protein [Deltaproteobacteria bacterium]